MPQHKVAKTTSRPNEYQAKGLSGSRTLVAVLEVLAACHWITKEQAFDAHKLTYITKSSTTTILQQSNVRARMHHMVIFQKENERESNITTLRGVRQEIKNKAVVSVSISNQNSNPVRDLGDHKRMWSRLKFVFHCFEVAFASLRLGL